jgi:hypothetical protein
MLSARDANRRRTTLKQSTAAGHAMQQQVIGNGTATTGSSQAGQLAGVANGSAGSIQQQQEQANGPVRDGAAGADSSSQGLQQQAWPDHLAPGAAAGSAAAAVSVRSSINKGSALFKGSEREAAVNS